MTENSPLLYPTILSAGFMASMFPCAKPQGWLPAGRVGKVRPFLTKPG